MASDFVGVTQVMEAYDGLDYNTGGSLDGIERAQRGLVGVSQMAATGALVGHAASATNAAASRLAASTSNATVARGAGLATTRVGPGFGARAATRMRVMGNLATSRAGNAASGFSSSAAKEAAAAAAEYGATPKGRPFTKHYATDTGPKRNIPGSVVDNTIDTTKGVSVKGGKTVHFDPSNNVTVVTGDSGRIVSVHKSHPRTGQF